MRTGLTLLVLALLAAGFLLLRGHTSAPEVDDDWTRDVARDAPAPDLRTEPGRGGGAPPGDPRGAGSAADAPRRTYAGVRGVVEDERGRPLAGADVRLATLDIRELRGAAARGGQTLATAVTAGGGAFELPLETHRWVRVTATRPGYATAGARVAGPGTVVRLVLPAAARLEVEVVGDEARGVVGAIVHASAREAVLVRETDGDGRARFDDLAPGTVTLEVRTADGRRARPLPLTVAPGPEARRVVVLLPDAVAVTGLVVDATGLPVEGAEVHTAQPGLAFAADPTGPDGVFGPVAAGAAGTRILLAVRAPGHAPRMVPVLLGPGETVQQIPPIALHEVADWRGRVVDAQGRPVANARVTTTSAGVAGRAPPATRTDEEGRFALPPPSPPAPGRRVVLCAEAAAGTAALPLRPGDAAPVDLVLVLASGRTVTGRVVRASGKAAAGASVRLEARWSAIDDRRRPGPETSRLLAMSDTARLALATATDTAGRWRVDAVPDGTYDVRVVHDAATAFLDEPLVVAAADVDAGVLRLGDGHAVEGTVVDDAGRPLAGVEMVLRAAEGDPRLRRTYSDGDGHWRLAGVPAGAWTLLARGGVLAVRRVELQVPTPEPVDLALGPVGRITGRVVDASGAPYRGVFRVRLEGTTPPAGTSDRAFHDPQGGRFVLDDVWPGTWTVRVETPAGALGRSAAPIETRPGTDTEVTIELGSGGVLAGTLHRPDGTPAAGGRIVLSRGGRSGTRTIATGADGSFRQTGLDTGTWNVVARGPGGAAIVERVDLAPGAAETLELVLGPVAPLEVVVRGRDGGARVGAYVLVRPAGGPTVHTTSVPRTDREGRVRLRDVPLGLVELEARTRDGEAGRTEIDLGASAPARVELVVSRSAPAPDDVRDR